MADKEGSKPLHPAQPVIVMFFIASVLGLLLMRIEEFLARHSGLSAFLRTLWLFITGQITFSQFVAATFSESLLDGLFVLRTISFVFCVFMVWAIIMASRKYGEVNKKHRAILKPPKEISYDIEAPVGPYVNPRWVKVLEHVNSNNPSDWRLAILEADIMLGDMLDKMGYHGATIGDKLKAIEPSDFTHLNEAWEAHKVRNAIAHEGSDMTLNKPEAERVIKLFEKVFKEFKYV
ncbi:MAG TPA: hypothetical protein VK145_01225 [Candidatus Nanoarchaeia archaeon]|nr:hypothetical protein [Candidatus Nanoarchaeia archaeon]